MSTTTVWRNEAEKKESKNEQLVLDQFPDVNRLNLIKKGFFVFKRISSSLAYCIDDVRRHCQWWSMSFFFYLHINIQISLQWSHSIKAKKKSFRKMNHYLMSIVNEFDDIIQINEKRREEKREKKTSSRCIFSVSFTDEQIRNPFRWRFLCRASLKIVCRTSSVHSLLVMWCIKRGTIITNERQCVVVHFLSFLKVKRLVNDRLMNGIVFTKVELYTDICSS